jgi:hypothetical protein
MSRETLTPQVPTTHLTDADREWIRRQGMTARALEEERRLVRDRLSAMNGRVARVRDDGASSTAIARRPG